MHHLQRPIPISLALDSCWHAWSNLMYSLIYNVLVLLLIFVLLHRTLLTPNPRTFLPTYINSSSAILFFYREEPTFKKMRITIKEFSMIRPAQDLNNEHLWLSNVDLLYERTFISTVYLFKSNSNSFETKSLKDAMSKVLVPFYPMAGRVGRDDNGRIVINCNNEGVLYIEAETDSAIDDLGDFMRNVEIMKLIPTVDSSNQIPPFILQVTTFTCGGISIGIRFHHLFADGHGALHFIKSWFDIARGLPISIPPLFDRTALCSREPPKPKFKHVEYHKPPIMNISAIQNPNKCQANNYIEIFKITPHQLNTLKARVNTEDIKYSSYKILLAHAWRCTTKARDLANDQKTRLNIAVDGRSRLHPQLQRGYFGNAIFYATPIALSSEILSETLKETVDRIDEEIKKVDDEYLRSGLDYLQEVDDLTPIMRGPNSSQCPNLNIVDWMKIPLYEADFGMGKPVYVTPAYPPEGIGYILPTPSGHDDGSRALVICLVKDHMQSFKKLFYEF